MQRSELQQALLSLHAQALILEQADRAALKIPAKDLTNYMSKLQQDQALAFDFLTAHTAIHWEKDQKFELLYQLYSTSAKHYCLISAELPACSPVIDSVSALWPAAQWLEREVYDMFGVLYRNHPDLRRLLLDDDWQGFPLRKDYKDDFMLERP